MPLARALSKLGILSRSRAKSAIIAGRVRVGGRVVRDPGHPVVPERAHITVDATPSRRMAWRAIAFHKPRGVVCTRSDPEGRPTIFDVLGAEAKGLVAAGRLDLATSGLLILTTDTQFANRLTDPRNAVARVYAATVRGRVGPDEIERLLAGITDRGERLNAARVTVRKTSARETHLIVELREGRNREIRRLFGAVGHEVTRLKRLSVGNLALGDLRPGAWRELSRAEVEELFPRREAAEGTVLA